VKLDEWTW